MMALALEEAEQAGRLGEVPVGAVLVRDSGKVISRAGNRTISACDPTAHAEVLTLRRAALAEGNYRLLNTTLYVTIEPCLMCMGAIVHARIDTLVYGAPDPKWGAAGSLYDFAGDSRLNHRVSVISGVSSEPAREIIQNFFKHKRGVK